MVVAIAPAASASLPAESGSGAPFVGYTDKAELTAAGRAVVASNELPVADGSAPVGAGTTYYVDSAGGDDAADGTSRSTAWKTLANVNATEFQPGDRILLKAGSAWSAEGDEVAKEAYDYTHWVSGTPQDVVGSDPTALLAPKGSGTAASPIVLSSYGDGPAPELNGRGVVNDVLQLTNQEHWDISNLEITNVTDGFDPSTFEPLANQGQAPGEENPATGDLRGIHVQAENAGTLRGYEIHNVFVHDVSGVTWSVSASGLDRSKRTGGIVFEGLKGDAQTVSQFEDVTVRDSYIANTAFANVTFKQFSGMGTNRYRDVQPGWGDRAVARASNTGVITEDPNWRPHTSINVSGNYLTNRGTQYGWNSMYLTSVQRATVEDNMIDGAGVSGIEMYYSDNIVVQNNEVAEIEVRSGAADSNGIDPDRGTSNILIQANYVHESGEGILLCGFGFSTAVVRYNVIQDVDKNYINPHGDSGVNLVYNNLMYNTQQPVRNNTVGFFQSSGSAGSYLLDRNRHYLFNNVFVNTREDVNAARFESEYPGVYFSNNAYHGPKVVPPSEDPNAVTGDPKIVGNPAEGIANAMIASADSPLIAAGTPVDLAQVAPGFQATGSSVESQLPLAVDFFGTDQTTPPTIGATTYVPAEGNGLVTGVVRDDQGDAVPGATVSYGSGAVTADGNGRYAIEAAVGQYTLVPSADGYADGQPVAVTLQNRETLSSDLTLGVTTATEGTLTGTVTTSGKAVAGATVTVSKGDATVATASTGTDGAYAFAALPAGEGYTVSVAKDGYQTASQSDVVIRAARTVTVDLALTAELGETVYAINETFDDEGTGSFTGTGDGALVARPNAGAGSITIEEDAARTGNKYLKIAKTGSGTLAVHNAVEKNLTGTVTIEARLQRTTTNGTPNQTAMYSYTESDWKSSDPATSSNPSATFGFSGGNIMTHNVTGTSSVKTVAPYTVGQWHTVRNVVDLGTGTFDFYVDDMTTPVLTDQPLRTTVDDLDYFLFFSSSSNRGDLLVDYFRVNTGAPYDYDDSSLGSVTAETAEGAVKLTSSADGLTYSGTVHPFTETVKIAATPGSAFAKVAVDGTEMTDGGSVEVELEGGSNDDAEIVTEVPVVVTAEDGTQSSYTVSISRTNPNQLAELRNLSVEGFELSPAFASDRQGEANPYEVVEALDSSVDSVQLAWDLGWADQEVQVNGQALSAGATGASVELEDGENVIEVTVSSYTGDVGTYVVKMTREAVSFTAAAEIRHLGPRAFLAVDVVNGEDVPVDIVIQTVYGERTLDDVPPGKELTQLFPARDTTVPAGEITVTATAEIDGEVVISTRQVAYDAG